MCGNSEIRNINDYVQSSLKIPNKCDEMCTEFLLVLFFILIRIAFASYVCLCIINGNSNSNVCSKIGLSILLYQAPSVGRLDSRLIPSSVIKRGRSKWPLVGQHD